jgi:hypothetical protein
MKDATSTRRTRSMGWRVEIFAATSSTISLAASIDTTGKTAMGRCLRLPAVAARRSVAKVDAVSESVGPKLDNALVPF